MQLTPAQTRAHADEVRETSVTLLRGLIPDPTIKAQAKTAEEELAEEIRRQA